MINKHAHTLRALERRRRRSHMRRMFAVLKYAHRRHQLYRRHHPYKFIYGGKYIRFKREYATQ